MRDEGQVARATQSVVLEGLAASALCTPAAQGMPSILEALGALDLEKLERVLAGWEVSTAVAFKMLDLALVGPEVRLALATTAPSPALVELVDAFLVEHEGLLSEVGDARLLAHSELRLGLERGILLGEPLDLLVMDRMLDPPWPGLASAVSATLAEQLRNVGYPTLAELFDAPSLAAFRLLVGVLAQHLWGALAASQARLSIVPAHEGLRSELARRDSTLETYLRTADRPRSGMVRRSPPTTVLDVETGGFIELDSFLEDDPPPFRTETDESTVEWDELDSAVHDAGLFSSPEASPDSAGEGTERIPSSDAEKPNLLWMGFVILAFALFLVAMALVIR